MTEANRCLFPSGIPFHGLVGAPLLGVAVAHERSVWLEQSQDQAGAPGLDARADAHTRAAASPRVSDEHGALLNPHPQAWLQARCRRRRAR